MGTIEWLFASNQALGINYMSSSLLQTTNTKDEITKYSFENNFQLEWESISAVASYSYIKSSNTLTSPSLILPISLKNNEKSQRFEKNDTFIKLALSKYQIHESHLNSRLDSILTIKLINEKDFGIYKCIAKNELGNKTINYKVEGKKKFILKDKLLSIKPGSLLSFRSKQNLKNNFLRL